MSERKKDLKMKYNYLENIKEDVKNYIEENKDNESYNFNNIDEVRDLLYDDLWLDDAVTGNGSGSYYCNSYKAREALNGNEDLLVNALEEFGNDAESYKRSLTDPEFADVTIRCYLLGQAIDEVLEELPKENNKTIIKIVKFMEYTTKKQETIKKEIHKEQTRDIQEAIKMLNNEPLHYYNNKYLQVTETIEATYKTSTGYKKIYKTIKTDGTTKKNY